MNDFEYAVAMAQLPKLKTLVAQDAEIRATRKKLLLCLREGGSLPLTINAYKYMSELQHQFQKAFTKTSFIQLGHIAAHKKLARLILDDECQHSALIDVFKHDAEIQFDRLPVDLLHKLIRIVGSSQLVKHFKIEVVPRPIAVGIGHSISPGGFSGSSRLIELELIKVELGNSSNFTLLEHLLRLARLLPPDQLSLLQDVSNVKDLTSTALTNLQDSI